MPNQISLTAPFAAKVVFSNSFASQIYAYPTRVVGLLNSYKVIFDESVDAAVREQMSYPPQNETGQDPWQTLPSYAFGFKFATVHICLHDSANHYQIRLRHNPVPNQHGIFRQFRVDDKYLMQTEIGYPYSQVDVHNGILHRIIISPNLDQPDQYVFLSDVHWHKQDFWNRQLYYNVCDGKSAKCEPLRQTGYASILGDAIWREQQTFLYHNCVPEIEMLDMSAQERMVSYLRAPVLLPLAGRVDISGEQNPRYSTMELRESVRYAGAKERSAFLKNTDEPLYRETAL